MSLLPWRKALSVPWRKALSVPGRLNSAKIRAPAQFLGKFLGNPRLLPRRNLRVLQPLSWLNLSGWRLYSTGCVYAQHDVGLWPDRLCRDRAGHRPSVNANTNNF